MELKKYTSHFHDGLIDGIHYNEDEIVLTMVSAEIDPKYLHDLSILSNSGRFCGKLHIQGVKKIEEVNGENHELQKYLDRGTILDLEIHDSVVEFDVLWEAWKVSDARDIFVSHRIEAESIYWENLPDFIDLENPPIECYCGHFVEGTLKDIRFEERQIGFEDKYGELRMVLESTSVTSAHKVPQWLRLTSSDTLLGSLQMIWIQRVLRDGKEVEVDAVSMLGSTALIKSLTIENHWVTLDLEWQNEDRTLAVKERMEVLAGSITWRDRLT